MRPALSVIVFTTLSGTGYGIVMLLGVLAPLGLLPQNPLFGAISLIVAIVVITIGLFASALHLGHPERAWRAFSQWRSSWLSREGVAAVVTFVPILAFGLTWLIEGRVEGQALPTAFAAFGALCALVTVICTSMIYTSLKTIRQWHNQFVPVGYILFSLFSGAAWLNALAGLSANRLSSDLAILTIALGIAALALKLLYWRFIDTSKPSSTLATATGLGGLGTVRALDPPHLEDNYLLKEMGFAIARKHARKLRSLAVVLGFILPAALTPFTLSAFLGSAALAVLLALAALLGLIVERWLFFAEATHTVVLYYGRAI